MLLEERDDDVPEISIPLNAVPEQIFPVIGQYQSSTNADAVAFHVAELARVTREAADYDIVHSHLEVLGFPFGRHSPTPFIHTMHGRLDLPELQVAFRELADAPLVSISDNQRGPLANANWVRTVYNGIAMERVPFGNGDGCIALRPGESDVRDPNFFSFDACGGISEQSN